jgi:hypothetical protein
MYSVYAWLSKWFLFQTFEELDSNKDKEIEIRQIRLLLSGQQDHKKEVRFW